MKSNAFAPVKSISFEELCSLVKPSSKGKKEETPNLSINRFSQNKDPNIGT